MKIKHRILSNQPAQEILDFLESNNIKYKNTAGMITLTVDEDAPYLARLLEFVKDYDLVHDEIVDYQKKDLEEATWLSIRSRWSWGYPQPEDDFAFLAKTYDQEKYCNNCGAVRLQKGPFYLKKEPPWGKRHLLQLNWVYDQLFIRPEVSKELREAGFTGFSTLRPRHYRKDEDLETIEQLVIDTILDEGLVEMEGLTSSTCPVCGRKKYFYPGQLPLKYKKEIFQDAPDFVLSGELFGSPDLRIAARYLIVSNRVYRLFDRKKWKDVIFEPLELV